MKSIQILIIVFLISATSGFAQKKGTETVEFEVSGICGMCKERIENALDVNGVKFVEYTTGTHMCKVVYKSDKISEDELHQLLNEAGHDTEKSLASDEQYQTVHACCRYRDDHDH